MICLHETKKESPAINTAGGILCIWSEVSFAMQRKIVGSGFIMLEGIWKEVEKELPLQIYMHPVT